MDAPIRSDELYFADIRAVLAHFYRPGDFLILVRQFYEARKCEMCGGKVDIKRCFELRNRRSGEKIVCGRMCIVKYAKVLEEMQEEPRIIFPAKYDREAQRINHIRPETVTVSAEEEAFEEDIAALEQEQQEIFAELRREELLELGLDPDNPDYGELASEGLDPEDVDWDSVDYE